MAPITWAPGLAPPTVPCPRGRLPRGGSSRCCTSWPSGWAAWGDCAQDARCQCPPLTGEKTDTSGMQSLLTSTSPMLPQQKDVELDSGLNTPVPSHAEPFVGYQHQLGPRCWVPMPLNSECAEWLHCAFEPTFRITKVAGKHCPPST
jgi:hypothetical protein